MDMSLSKLWKLVMGKEAWRAAIHGVTKSGTRLSNSVELNQMGKTKARYYSKVILSNKLIKFYVL